tara:strand:- start:468 stop:656 length:189 start_codon:yes stop_codon:yes gene_type:complete
MSKTLYYRETNPQTGKQTWVKLNGVTGVNSMIFIDPKEWEKIDDKTGFNLFIVYKRPSKKRF